MTQNSILAWKVARGLMAMLFVVCGFIFIGGSVIQIWLLATGQVAAPNFTSYILPPGRIGLGVVCFLCLQRILKQGA